ncbi:penicillin-binding protein activator [Myxococcota bacterium]|nr:penicillin-binding protein activator [Myxococcota bacterium]
MRRRAVVVLWLLGPWALGCAVLPGARGGAAADRRALDAALRGAEESPEIGRGRLVAFLRSHPGSPLFDDAALALARLERSDENPAAAERPLRDALVRQPRGDRVDAVRLELAELARERGDEKTAWREAQRVRLGLLRDDERPRAARLIADLARSLGDPVIEVEALGRLRDDTPAGQTAEIDARLARALDELSTETLLQIVERLGQRDSAALLWIAIGERALQEHDSGLARRALARAERAPLVAEDAARRERLSAALGGRAAPESRVAVPPMLGELDGQFALPDPHQLSGAIGVALPLSGPFAAVAEETLTGILLAAGLFGPPDGSSGSAPPGSPAAGSRSAPAPAPGGGLRVLVRDTGGTPDGAAAAVRALAAQPEVRAVIGPLLSEEVHAAAEAAVETGVPLLALTRHEAVARSGPEVFRLALTRDAEAEVLADHVVRDLGLQRIAILYPKDDYGREFEALLWQAIEARGARVVGVAGYVPGSRDLSGPIRQLVGWTLLDAEQRARLQQRDAGLIEAANDPAPDRSAAAGEPAPGRAAIPLSGRGFAWSDPEPDALPPIVDFDALFVPDAPDTIGLLLPQLVREGVERVVLFGPSAWSHAELLRQGGTRMEGFFFTSSFDPSHPAPLVQDFARRYRSGFGREGSVFAAQGFDAVNLVAWQLSRGATERSALRDALRTTTRYPGVSGPTSFANDGNAAKRPFLVGIRSGQMVSIE